MLAQVQAGTLWLFPLRASRQDMLLELLSEEHGELLALSMSSFEWIFKPFQILGLYL